MIKVLLVHSYSTRGAWVPIGLLYIAANLRKNGIQVKIVDTRHEDIYKEIDIFIPDILGFGAMTVNAPYTIRLAKEIKEKYPNIIQVFGGVHFTVMPEDSIGDILIKGEGEKAFVDLCNGKEVKEELNYDLDSMNQKNPDNQEIASLLQELIEQPRNIAALVEASAEQTELSQLIAVLENLHRQRSAVLTNN